LSFYSHSVGFSEISAQPPFLFTLQFPVNSYYGV
jgi:hypothetical protein